MDDQTKYPFKLVNVFLISLSMSRINELPNPLELQVAVEVKYIEPGFPTLQINMKVSSTQDAPLSFNLEAVGLFEFIGDDTEYDRELNREFVFERGLHMLWIFISQTIRLITSQMGMNPLNLQAPISFVSNQD